MPLQPKQACLETGFAGESNHRQDVSSRAAGPLPTRVSEGVIEAQPA